MTQLYNDDESMLRVEEGERLYVYPDQFGFDTIGVGIMVDKRKGGGLLPEESAFILRNRLTKTRAALLAKLPWFAQLSAVRQAVLVSMAHQLGQDGLLGFKHMLAAAMIGDFAQAAGEIRNSQLAKQTPARAEREAKMMETGEWPST